MTPGGVDTDLSDCVDTDSVAVDPEESSRSSGVDDDSLGVPQRVFSVARGGVDDQGDPAVSTVVSAVVSTTPGFR